MKSCAEVNPDAMKIARNADLERSDGLVRGLLHGIPFMVKDNIASKYEKSQRPMKVWRFKAPSYLGTHLSRAVLMGKKILSEWADARSSKHP